MCWSPRNDTDERHLPATDEQEEGRHEERAGRAHLLSADLLLPYLSAGDGVIDLGANVGRYAAKYAEKVGSRGYVLAVEPDTHSTAMIRKAYGKKLPQIRIAEVLAWQSSNSPEFVRDAGDNRRNSVWADNTIQRGTLVRCPAKTLDELADGVPALKAIKMDVQGAECHVLDGAQQTLARNLAWAVEFWPEGLRNAGRSPEELADQFRAHGYVIAKSSSGIPRDWDALLHMITGYDGHKSTDVLVVKHSSPETSR